LVKASNTLVEIMTKVGFGPDSLIVFALDAEPLFANEESLRLITR